MAIDQKTIIEEGHLNDESLIESDRDTAAGNAMQSLGDKILQHPLIDFWQDWSAIFLFGNMIEV